MREARNPLSGPSPMPSLSWGDNVSAAAVNDNELDQAQQEAYDAILHASYAASSSTSLSHDRLIAFSSYLHGRLAALPRTELPLFGLALGYGSLVSGDSPNCMLQDQLEDSLDGDSELERESRVASWLHLGWTGRHGGGWGVTKLHLENWKSPIHKDV
ncbi:related to RNA-binding protein [Sporisorium scitamineum]|uniref:Related to RNA-binding protein n=1 Tax=Sporisorium scitamineum TaxID=49012 RepID=A0A140KLW2_9BASI|nr:related to RNA-binding protein [Sporisorium scitamineum]